MNLSTSVHLCPPTGPICPSTSPLLERWTVDKPSGIPKHCTQCGTRLLNPHELTGLCLECKLIARNERNRHRESR